MRIVMFVLCVAVLALTSCKKDNDFDQAERDAQLQSAEDFATADAFFQNAFDMTDEEAKQQEDLNGLRSDSKPKVEDRNGCVTVDLKTADAWPNIWPITLTLDYGTSCTNPNGDEVSGKIVAVYDGVIHEQGATSTLSFENFSINNFTLNGTQQVTNQGNNSDGQMTFKVEVINGSLVFPGGKSITHTSSQIRTWVEGQQTNFWTNGLEGILDDVWEVDGTSTGVNRLGENYTITTDAPLRAEIRCPHLTSGLLRVKTSNMATDAFIDYGDGDCDNKALFKYGSYETTFNL